MTGFINIRAMLLLLLFILLPTKAYAENPTTEWINFYSSSTLINDQPISIGAEVTAHDPMGVECGAYTVDEAGQYGFLACYIDDMNTPLDEGIRPGDTVTFRIDGANAGSFAVPDSVQNGDRFQVDLSVNISVTGSSGNQGPDDEPIPVPEPITIILFGTGLAGLAGRRLIRKR